MEKEWIQELCNGSKKDGEEMTCDVKTLRGITRIAMGQENWDYHIFGYEGTDQTRGWQVLTAECWFADPYTGGTKNRPALCRMKLQTDVTRDTLPVTPGWDGFDFNPGDNREFGWCTRTYDGGDVDSDSIFPKFSSSIIDPEHMITRDFYLSFPCVGMKSDEGNEVDVAWIITMEEVKISPDENILQSVKGIAQNITN